MLVRTGIRIGWLSLIVAGAWTAIAGTYPMAASRSPREAPQHESRPAAGSDGPDQAGHCPRGERPGEILWTYSVARNMPLDGLFAQPAVAADGTVFVGTRLGMLHAVDCTGRLRWTFDAMTFESAGPIAEDFHAPPVLDERGRLYIAGRSGAKPAVLFALDPDRSLHWRFDTGSLGVGMSALALDQQGRLFSAGSRAGERFDHGRLIGIDRFGALLEGYPMETTPLQDSPIVLSGDRVAFVSPPNSRSRPATMAPVGRPDPSETPRATATSGPAIQALVHLPIVRTDRLPLVTPEATGNPVAVPPQLHVVNATGAELIARVPVDARGSIVAAGDVVILTTREFVAAGRGARLGAPRLLAFSVDAAPPRLIWEFTARSNLVQTPVLGRMDAASGMLELVYLDDFGILGSLRVPVRPQSGERPRFEWALTLESGGGDHALKKGGLVLGDAGRVYVAFGDSVHAIDRGDASAIWSIRLQGEVSNGTVTMGPGGVLFVGTQSGKLYAIATESRGLDPDAAWPAARHDSRNTGRAGW